MSSPAPVGSTAHMIPLNLVSSCTLMNAPNILQRARTTETHSSAIKGVCVRGRGNDLTLDMLRAQLCRMLYSILYMLLTSAQSNTEHLQDDLMDTLRDSTMGNKHMARKKGHHLVYVAQTQIFKGGNKWKVFFRTCQMFRFTAQQEVHSIFIPLVVGQVDYVIHMQLCTCRTSTRPAMVLEHLTVTYYHPVCHEAIKCTELVKLKDGYQPKGGS